MKALSHSGARMMSSCIGMKIPSSLIIRVLTARRAKPAVDQVPAITMTQQNFCRISDLLVHSWVWHAT